MCLLVLIYHPTLKSFYQGNLGLKSCHLERDWYRFEKAFDKNLYIEKGYKYEEIKIKQIKLKWYNLLSHIIRVNHKEENKVIQRLDLIPKITYR